MNKGFTLIEIIVVLIILGVLAAIALPAYFSWVDKAKAAAIAVPSLKSFKESVLVCEQVKNNSLINFSACLNQTANAVITGLTTPLTGVSISGQWISPTQLTYNFKIIRDLSLVDSWTPGMVTCPDGNTSWAQKSGFMICRDINGNITMQSWGMYQGMY